jgi:hypothetical protein
VQPSESWGVSRRSFIKGALASLAIGQTGSAWAEEGWEKFAPPPTSQGLVINPRLLNVRGRLNMYWAGTSGAARAPEVYYCNKSGDDEGWGKVYAPFFGSDLARVRRLAVATARDATVLLFQRETSQGNGAVEVQMTVSGDGGYSFSTPFVLDSYVLGEEGGSYISVAARQGTKRPEFAALWVAEDGIIRACNIDPRSGFRPRALPIGTAASIKSKVEVVGAGGEGFFAIWPEGSGLKCSHIKPLTGSMGKAENVAGGEFLRNFSAAGYYRGPAFISASNESGQFGVYEARGDKLESRPTPKFPVPGRKLDSRTCLENQKHLHMAVVEGGKTPKMWYVTNRGGSWSQPTLICNLEPEVPVTGFDIEVTEGYVWAVVGQEQLIQLRRLKLA